MNPRTDLEQIFFMDINGPHIFHIWFNPDYGFFYSRPISPISKKTDDRIDFPLLCERNIFKLGKDI